MPARVLTRLPVLLRICAGRAILTTHHRHPDFALSPFPARAQSRQAVRPSMYQTARRRVVYEPPSLNVGTPFLVPDTTHSLPLTISPRSSTPSPLRSDRSSKFTMTERPWVRLFSIATLRPLSRLIIFMFALSPLSVLFHQYLLRVKTRQCSYTARGISGRPGCHRMSPFHTPLPLSSLIRDGEL